MANRLVSVGDDSVLPASIRLADINLPSWAKSDAAGAKVVKGELVFSVLDEGAKGDATDAGGTDDTAAFQAAMNKAGAVGGTMFIPPRTYKLDGYVQIKSNVRVIGYGATIRKYSSNSTYSAFQALSNGQQGYGSSATNVTFEGLTFRGRFSGVGTGNGNAVTLHHAQGITFRKCTWTEAILSGHAIDLLGCDGVLVDDCTFKGFNVVTDREYVEAIQVDYSTAASGGSDTTNSFDGLPTINVTVQNSRFVQLTVGATTYPAPNPIGSHTRVAGRWLENIKFDNNYVEGGDANAATSGFGVTNKGWIHFLCARNVKITRNVFKNVNGRLTKVVYFNTIGTGTALADVQNPNAASTSMTVMPVENFTFDGNTLIGFTNDNSENLVEVQGTDPATGGVSAKRVWITNNTVKDSYSTPGVTGDKGAYFVYLASVSGATIAGNELQDAAAYVYAYKSNRVTLSGGNLVNLGTYAGRFSTCTDITIRDVNVDGHGGGYWFYNGCVGVQVMGGTILNGRADALKTKHFSLSGASEFSIRNVRMPKDANGYTAAIDLYSTSTKGKVKDNFATGWVNDAGFVNLGSGSAAAITENTY